MMAATIYSYEFKPINGDLLTQEIIAAGLPAPDMVSVTATTVDIVMPNELTPAQVDTLSAVVAAHQPPVQKQTRSVFAIYNDLAGLSNANQDAIVADLQLTSLSGKWTSLKPPQDGAAAGLNWSATSLSGATANEKRKAAGWIVAMYCQQNPAYLVHPPFAPAIDIPGDEAV